MKKPFLSIFLLAISFLNGTILNERPAIAMNEHGDAVVLWESYDAAHFHRVIQAALLPLGEAWSAPETLSSSENEAKNPKVAIDGTGRVMAVWEEAAASSTSSIYAARQVFGVSGWTAPQLVSATTNSDTFPEIDLDANGNGLLLWQKNMGKCLMVRASTYSAESGLWSDAATLNTDSRTMPFPEAVVNESGKAFAFWQQFNTAARRNEIQFSASTLGGAWSAPVALSDFRSNATSVQAAINDAGGAVAVWVKGDETGVCIEAMIGSAEGIWGNAVLISSPDTVSTNPFVAINSSGKIVAIWQGASSTTQTIQACVYSGGAWSSPSTLSDSSLKASHPQIVINDAGQAIAVWAANNVIQAAILSADNTWSAASQLSNPLQSGLSPQVGMDALGYGVAVWQAVSGSDKTIQASVFNGASWSAVTTISN